MNVGGEEPFENEIRSPKTYGVKQAVGDTLGPGGIFRALRTAPTGGIEPPSERVPPVLSD
nr:hypothetical protein [Natrinema sp. SYSU A 869]